MNPRMHKEMLFRKSISKVAGAKINAMQDSGQILSKSVSHVIKHVQLAQLQEIRHAVLAHQGTS